MKDPETDIDQENSPYFPGEIDEMRRWADVIDRENAKAELGGQPPRTRASIPPKYRKKDPKRVAAGKRARSSGARMELEARRELEALGVAVERMPVSGRGRARGKGGDLEIPGLGRVEIKGRAGGFRTLYRWLETMAALMVRGKQETPGEKRPEWLAVIRVADLAALIKKAQFFDEIACGDCLGEGCTGCGGTGIRA